MSKMPLYAIVDIETTGGRAVRDKITEIGIVLYDGTKIVEQYQSLINPECPIPYSITQLTGITQDMVAEAPRFPEVARRIVELTEGAIFVAHNVRFDYSFLRAEFARLGYTYTRKTLCTVRMSRQTFPGLRSYSLGNLIRHFGIRTEDRHRALADAQATTELLQYIQRAQDNESASLEWIQLGLKESLLPQGLNLEIIQNLPESCGVYYFQDRAGDVVYIGKSINIRKRIIEHFRDKTEKARKLQQVVHTVHYEVTGSELIALLLESYEIKRVQPPVNKAQRMRNYPYVIHQYTDNRGIRCLEGLQVTATQRKSLKVVNEYPTLTRTKSALMGVVDKYGLCNRYCGLEKTEAPCFHFHIRQCQGVCAGQESIAAYNERAEAAIERLSTMLEGSFFLLDKGREASERSVVLIEEGVYRGYGFIDQSTASSVEDLANAIRNQPDNAEIRRLIKRYLEEHPTTQKILVD
jgi:DNA polymerase-3 subunit epsilon